MKKSIKKDKEFVESLLNKAGVSLNGKNDYDIQVLDDRFYHRVISQGSLGLGESYMDGWWTCKSVDEFITRLLLAKIDKNTKITPRLFFHILSALVFNLQNKARGFNIGKKHYDIGNDLYKQMLDKRMLYTCAYWKNADNLDKAQEDKLDLVCRKLNLKKGMKLLDIGCGWGSFAKFAVEKYGVSVVGITVSKKQAKLAQTICRGLPVEIRLQDYRDVNEKFDQIVSLGMFEHVGFKNYGVYMKKVHSLLKDGGLFLLHTIGGNESAVATDQWINKYIFPDSLIPSIKQIAGSIENLLIVEDWHNFGTDYDKTLMAWYHNISANWHKLGARYDDRFKRMWEYYLLACAGTFRSRRNQVWQIVMSKEGTRKSYDSVR